MKYYWFGDSWVWGDELQHFVPAEQCTQSGFPRIVSDMFGAECVNLAQRGSSIDLLPYEFSKIVNDIDPTVDKVFFFLTADHRASKFDQNGELKNILPSAYSEHNIHEHIEKWYKYFDNPYQRLYNYDCIVNLLYFWCANLSIDCYFANIFTVQNQTMFDQVPKENWLVPKNKCIAEYILPVVGNESVITQDQPGVTVEQWRQQEPCVAKYITPCTAHPNLDGHQEIAKQLIKVLNAKTE
jgi:hypothetical protein